MIDVSATIVAKSDQINAADIADPITVEILDVRLKSGDDQPVEIEITNYKPWRPCKSMRRLLARMWGTDASRWIGQRITLYHEASVSWAGQPVGGIRVSAMSGIDGDQNIRLPAKRGKYETHSIARIDTPAEPTMTIAELAEAHGLTVEQITAWHEAAGRKPDREYQPARVAALGEWLGKDPANVVTVRGS